MSSFCKICKIMLKGTVFSPSSKLKQKSKLKALLRPTVLK